MSDELPAKPRKTAFQRMFDIPWLGEIFGTVLLFMPILAVGLIEQAAGVETSFVDGIAESFPVAIPVVLIAWLVFVERRVHVRLTLPVIPIPWLWVMLGALVYGTLLMFGFVSEPT